MTHEEILELARELNSRREPYALVTVVRAVAPTSAYLGAQAIVLADGTLHGWIGGGCAKDVVIGAARNAIGNGEPKLVRISNDRIQADDDIEQHTMSCASNGTIELFIQPYSARSALCVLGRTPAADEARFFAERLRIRLAEDPGEAPVVLVATQGQGDEDALERALRSPAEHVLMIASRRKAERLREVMRSAASTRPGSRGYRRRQARMRGRRRREKSRWWRSSGCSRSCAAERNSRQRCMACQRTPLSQSLGRRRPSARAEPGAASSGAKFVNPVCGIAVDTTAPKHVESYERYRLLSSAATAAGQRSAKRPRNSRRSTAPRSREIRPETRRAASRPFESCGARGAVRKAQAFLIFSSILKTPFVEPTKRRL